MDACLSAFDVTGIQQFIFSSIKAKENIGASIYIQEIFEKKLIEILKQNADAHIDWRNAKSLAFFEKKLSCEVLYIGGGNALVLFRSKDLAVETAKKLSVNILEETQGTLHVVVAHLETALENFESDRQRLFQILQENKASHIPSRPLGGIAITRECSDGLSSSGHKDISGDTYLSNVAMHKRNFVKNSAKNTFDALLPTDFNYPVELDHLGQKEGENQIAVIHIDGNSMGRTIEELLKDKKHYPEAIATMRQISRKIDHTYKKVFSELLGDLAQLTRNEKLRKEFFYRPNLLPIRPIILNGDDVTFVCNARLAIPLVERFLSKIADHRLEVAGQSTPLSACAGIAVVKSHFPFHHAYELAESLCASAKRKGKYYDTENPGNWFDFHIVYSGFYREIDTIRVEQYNLSNLPPIQERGYPKYHLLFRPFAVQSDADGIERFEWSRFVKNLLLPLRPMNREGGWSRSRLKKLRQAFLLSPREVDILQKENRSRGCALPEFKGDGLVYNDENIFPDNQTPYFDAIELLEFYREDLWNQEAES